MTKLLGVLGDPVSHSLSPVIHSHWIREAGLDATYEALRVAPDEFNLALETLSTRDCVGFNVTLPHKTAAFGASALLSDAAQAIGAVNTLTLQDNGAWHGHNTDASGFLDALDRQNIAPKPETKVIVIGAGGAARAVVYALSSIAVLPLILNRTEAKARQLSTDLTGSEAAYGSVDHLYGRAAEADLVIKALGFEPEALPTLWDQPELEVTRWGTIKAAFTTGKTQMDGVYAVGDIVRGASLVVCAIRDGRDCADASLQDFGTAAIAAE